MIRRLLSLGLLALLVLPGFARAQDTARYPLIPWPQKLEAREGSFTINAKTRLLVSDPSNREVADIAGFFADLLRTSAGFDLKVSGAPKGAVKNAVVFRLDTSATALGAEGYRLDVDRNGAIVTAAAPAGLFYGLQTLRQLLPPQAGADQTVAGVKWTLPAVAIEDMPRFVHRGVHLDVVRHFFPVSFVKKYIDLLALYKMNTFHWHLTDDQGWRIEIKRYPKLTEIGGYRKHTMIGSFNDGPVRFDGKRYGGFYTQDEIRDVVAYAAKRHINVIPEIEMPGHALAALSAYPELACTEGPFEATGLWGVFDDIFCPKEETFTFLENVLAEVMTLFPSKYIHIGGDEAPKKRWEESPIAKEVMQREGLKDAHELQSYFVQRIEKYLNRHGRIIIGWDEILEGGLAPNAVVMSWRGTSGGITAARAGHDVIMAPNDDMYFDHYQVDPKTSKEPLAFPGSLTTLEDVYRFEPVPAELEGAQARHVLGAQANVWTEYIPSTEQVEYMVFPRLLALTEVVWSPKSARDWSAFQQRLPLNLRMLDVLKVNYRRPTS